MQAMTDRAATASGRGDTRKATSTGLSAAGGLARLAGMALLVLSLLSAVTAYFLKATPWEGEDLGFLVTIVALLIVSGFLMVKRPDHPVSWVMATSAFVLAAGGSLSWIYAERVGLGLAEVSPLGRVAAAVGGSSFFTIIYVLGCLLPLLFPTGTPPSSRWRPVGWTGGAALIVIVAGSLYLAATHGIEELMSGEPLRTGIPWLDGLVHAAIPVLALCSVVAVASLVVRYRRARGVERKQLQWFVLGAAVAIVGVVTEFTYQSTISAVLLLIGVLALPISIAVAILRYRLYEIDRLVSRTVSYAVVVGLLVGVFFGIVLVLRSLIPVEGPVPIAVSTLAVAGLFNPLRRRVQGLVDRRFNRSRYDAEREVARFAERLRAELGAEDLAGEVLGVVARTMQPARASIWIKESG